MSEKETISALVDQAFRERLGPEQTLPDDYTNLPLTRFGFDSLEFFEMIMTLEDEHDIVLIDPELHEDVTLSDMIAMATRRTPTD